VCCRRVCWILERSTPTATVILKGSERTAVAQSRVVGPADATERLEVSIIVRRRAAQVLRARTAALAAGNRDVGHLTREQFAAQHGADEPDMAAVRHVRQQIRSAHRPGACGAPHVGVVGNGCAIPHCVFRRAQRGGTSDGTYRGRTGAIHLPPELDGIVEAVLGLDNRPQAKPHFRIRSGADSPLKTRARASSSVSYTPVQVAALYGFPAGTGKGQCVGIVELGGGFRPADLKTYFTKLKVGSPKVLAVSVDHGTNAPSGSANGADGEVMLDIEVVGSVAPAANIAVYFAPNTDAGFVDAVTSAIHDTTNKPSVISISWGSAESTGPRRP